VDDPSDIDAEFTRLVRQQRIREKRGLPTQDDIVFFNLPSYEAMLRVIERRNRYLGQMLELDDDPE